MKRYVCHERTFFNLSTNFVMTVQEYYNPVFHEGFHFLTVNNYSTLTGSHRNEERETN